MSHTKASHKKCKT